MTKLDPNPWWVNLIAAICVACGVVLAVSITTIAAWLAWQLVGT